MANFDPCNASRPGDNPHIKCRRAKKHLLHHSKYERQHMDSRAIPRIYWDATEEEVKAAYDATYLRSQGVVK